MCDNCQLTQKDLLISTAAYGIGSFIMHSKAVDKIEVQIGVEGAGKSIYSKKKMRIVIKMLIYYATQFGYQSMYKKEWLAGVPNKIAGICKCELVGDLISLIVEQVYDFVMNKGFRAENLLSDLVAIGSSEALRTMLLKDQPVPLL